MLDAKTCTTDMLTVPPSTCGANNDKTLFTDSHKAIPETLSSPSLFLRLCSENLGINIPKMVTTLLDLITPSAHKARRLSFSSTKTSKVKSIRILLCKTIQNAKRYNRESRALLLPLKSMSQNGEKKQLPRVK